MSRPTKTDLRKELIARRKALTPAEHRQKDVLIQEKLAEAVDWSAVKTLHYFEPILRLGEPDVTDFLSSLKVSLYTSRKIGGTWQTIAIDTGKPADEVAFDAIVVPLLGFDASLHRIGYGGGYYDRFLASQQQAKKIGICYEFGKVDDLPHEPHDIPLDMILSENKISTSV